MRIAQNRIQYERDQCASNSVIVPSVKGPLYTKLSALRGHFYLPEL